MFPVCTQKLTKHHSLHLITNSIKLRRAQRQNERLGVSAWSLSGGAASVARLRYEGGTASPATHNLTDAVARPPRLLGLCGLPGGGRGDRHFLGCLLALKVFLEQQLEVEGPQT